MGAWGYAVLEDDIALDMMDELKESFEPKTKVYNFLNTEADYELQEILLAVAIVDASLHGLDETIFGGFYGHKPWLLNFVKTPMEDLKEDAMKAIQFVKEEDVNLGWREDTIENRKNLLIKIEKRLKEEE